MNRPSNRRGFTLVEALIAVSLALVVLSVVIAMFVSGSKLFGRSITAARGPEAALIVMDRLADDLVQAIQAPGDPRPPAAVAEGGTRLCFYVPAVDHLTPNTVIAQPAWWHLVEAGGGTYHPARNGTALWDVLISSWQFELIEPSDVEGEEVPGWYVKLTARFPTGSVLGDDYEIVRVVRLRQPSSNFLHFLDHGGDLLPGGVRMLPPPLKDEGPELEPGFENLGSPPVVTEDEGEGAADEPAPGSGETSEGSDPEGFLNMAEEAP